MLNSTSIRAVDGATWEDRFRRPLYDSYCFSQIPQVIRCALGASPDRSAMERLLGPLAGSYNHVVLCFVDGFGWQLLERYGDRYPFLRQLLAEGYVTKLTSQFPSTTAAHTSAIQTGLEVGQSGLYEFFYYEPLVDDIISPLLFTSVAKRHEPGALSHSGVPAERFFPDSPTLYQRLAEHGVTSHVFLSKAYAFSPFSRAVTRGARVVPFGPLREALTVLVDLLPVQGSRSYSFLYFGSIDNAAHHHGVGSREFNAQADECLNLLESILRPALRRRKDTLLLLTADHGEIDTDPAATIHLDDLPLPFLDWMETTRRGMPIVPAGSSRDLFLHIRPEYLAEAHHSLRDQLAGRAEVHFVSDLIEQGFFGSAPPSEAFLGRVGNLVVLPYAGESVWWFSPPGYEYVFKANHGGLTPEEMDTELMAIVY